MGMSRALMEDIASSKGNKNKFRQLRKARDIKCKLAPKGKFNMAAVAGNVARRR